MTTVAGPRRPVARPTRTRRPWRLDPAVTFLNHGSYGACPEPVLAEQLAWRERMERQPVQFLGRDLEGLLDEARGEIGAFLGADPTGLAFVTNATTAINTVLRSLQFRPGDELLTTNHEYNATINAVAAVARRDGASVTLAQIPWPITDPAQATEAILAAATPRTRLAIVSHITSPTGIVLPIETIVDELARHGIDTLVDGAHAPGQVPVDLGALGAAYWTGNGHKWLCGPKGTAVLWVREDRRAAIHPLVTSHGANDPRTERDRFRIEADWTGTADPTAHLTLPAAIRFMATRHSHSWPGVMAANRRLALQMRRVVAEALGIEPPQPESMVGSMVALPLHGLTTDEAARALGDALAAEDRVELPIWGWPVRAARADPTDPPTTVILRMSAQRYNRLADAEALVAGLRRRGFGRSDAP